MKVQVLASQQEIKAATAWGGQQPCRGISRPPEGLLQSLTFLTLLAGQCQRNPGDGLLLCAALTDRELARFCLQAAALGRETTPGKSDGGNTKGRREGPTVY